MTSESVGAIMNGNDLHPLCSQNSFENEWWYYAGHLQAAGREFAFHLAFFRQRTDRMTIGRFLPLRLFEEHVRCAHFALTDIGKRQFHYGQRGPLGTNAGADANRFCVWHGDWMIQGAGETHQLKAKIRHAELALSLNATKPLVWHPYGGVFSAGETCKSFHLSYPRMQTRGLLTLDGEQFPVVGQAWMDRESGHFALDENRHGWDWFAMQFENNQELMVYCLHDDHRRPTEFSTGTLVDADHNVERLRFDQFQVAPLESWTSPRTGNVYPVRWRVSSASLDADLLVEPYLPCCEMDTRGSTSLIYWEGPGTVQGRLRGKPVRGHCFAELVGYDRQSALPGVYDFSSHNLGLFSFLANQARLVLLGPGQTVTQT